MHTTPASPLTPNASPLVLVNGQNGITVIPNPTPLTRLNFFDGKFLRAKDLNAEQRYLQSLVEYSNRAGGHGVAYGFNITQAGAGGLKLGPGLAIDPEGRVLLLPSEVPLDLQQLITRSQETAPATSGTSASTSAAASATFGDCTVSSQTPPDVVAGAGDLFVITIARAEALCGEEDVYGKLCEEACITSTDRPFRIEGVIVRARPLQLLVPLPVSTVVPPSQANLRSRVASACFESERRVVACHISKGGLQSCIWCLGAPADAGGEVALALVARSGGAIAFVDSWIVRRERLDAPAKRYWQWRMCMRPWDVFLAQILQFQCQVHHCVEEEPGPPGDDPCAQAQKLITEAARQFETVSKYFRDTSATLVPRILSAANSGAVESLAVRPSLTEITDLRERLLKVSQAFNALPSHRYLIDHCGVLELPSAGYLVVVPEASLSVNAQVRRLMGEGVDLRFCVCRSDYVAHVLEEAQHMERISLVQGLDDPSNKPRVDILVPDGRILSGGATPGVRLYAAETHASTDKTGALAYKGAAREESLASGGTALFTALAGLSQSAVRKIQSFARLLARPPAETQVEIVGNLESNPFIKKVGALGSRMDTLVGAAAARARTYIRVAAVGIKPEVPAAAANRDGTSDGLWLTAQSEKAMKSLGAGDQTQVSLRLLVGTHPDTPIGLDLSYKGTLLITGVAAATPALTFAGTLNGVLSAGLLQENQSQQRIIEYLLVERFNWPVKLTCSGDAAGGSVTLDIQMNADSKLTLRIRKTFNADASDISYQLALVSVNDGNETVVPAGELDLVADANVAKPGNPNHEYAENGLDLVQAALVVSEPGFKSKAESLLFPTLPPGTQELTVQAVRDWVLFTRRREKQCALDVLPPVLPPRSYRVINLTAKNGDEALAERKLFEAAFHDPDPSKVSKLIQLLLTRQERERLHLVVRFNGGSATPQSDLAAAEVDWRSFNPGATIAYAAIGAVGETDPNLQIGRLQTFESAISADSRKSPTAQEATIIPFPQDARPPDADGIMLFITVQASEPQHVYAATAEIFKLIQTAANAVAFQPSLGSLLGGDRPRDLGLANYTANPSGQVSVKDDAVVSAFNTQLPGSKIVQALEVGRNGDTDEDNQHRASSAQQIVKDLGAAAAHFETLVYAGTWPIKEPSVLVVQIQAPVTRNSLVIYALVDGGHIITQAAPRATVQFIDDVPQGGSLEQLAKNLTPNQPVAGVALAGITALDAGAMNRANAVAKALGHSIPASRVQTGMLSEADKQRLVGANVSLNGLDEVIFLENH